MKKHASTLAIVTMTIAGVLGITAIACSASQRQAEADLGKSTGDCVLECGIELALTGQEKSAPMTCGTRCLGKEITDPTQLADLARIVAGAKTAGAAAHKPDAGQ